MSWHIAPALKQMLAEVNKKWPGRSKASDGGIGNAAHSARASDHNPNGRGSVNAYDVTIKGINEQTLIAQAKKHPSVRYIIFNRRIMNRDIGNFAPRYYSGANPHDKHVHISLYQSASAERNTQSWGLAKAKAVAGGGGSSSSPTYLPVAGATPLVKPYSKGEPVKRIQKAVGVKVDGYYGPSTVKAVKAFQAAHGLASDGDVGPNTWKAILGGKVSKPKPAPSKPTPKHNPKAPAFPFPKGHWMGVPDSNPRNHSGYYSKDRPGIKLWQSRMKARGWTITADGYFGAQSQKVAKQFQNQAKVSQDGLVGAVTFEKAWSAPVT